MEETNEFLLHYLHYTTTLSMWNTGLRLYSTMDVIKMTRVNPKYYVKVKELMNNELPRPRLKPTILVTGWLEFLPLITWSW